MARTIRISTQTRINWLIDAAVFLGAVTASLTGIYFLYFTSGGYQGGRNALYGQTLFFERATWSDLHIWGSVLLIAAAVVHIAYHWNWIKMMARRYAKIITGNGVRMSGGAKINVAVNLITALSFLVVGISGIYFLFLTTGGYEGGQNPLWDPGFIFSRTTWDLIHTWSGVLMIVSGLIHFAIHWRWVVNMTKRFFQSIAQSAQRALQF
jgi:hypothetical protein